MTAGFSANSRQGVPIVTWPGRMADLTWAAMAFGVMTWGPGRHLAFGSWISHHFDPTHQLRVDW